MTHHDLISTAELAGTLSQPNLRVFDCTTTLEYLPPGSGAPYKVVPRRDSFEAGHIPGADFLDLQGEFSDNSTRLRFMMPGVTELEAAFGRHGVGADSLVVLYSIGTPQWATRFWWMLKSLGLDAAVLDGGWDKWKAEGRPLEKDMPALRERHYTAWYDAAKVRTKTQMLANLRNHAEQVVDARDAGRFTGEVPDFRPGVPSGHIPGSVNLPYHELFNLDGTFKDRAGLRAAFDKAGVKLGEPIVTSCGGGVTAAILCFALHLLGEDKTVSLYDGSWSEWAVDPDTPKEAGPALQNV